MADKLTQDGGIATLNRDCICTAFFVVSQNKIQIRYMGKKHEQGQILLIVVLIMVVSLTVGLSLVARSITNLKIASDDENSQRAFSAAEAGIERLVKSECTTQCILNQETFGNEASFTGNATIIQGGSILIKGGTVIRQDEGVDVWLSNYSTDYASLYSGQQSGTITVYWGASSDTCAPAGPMPAALEIMVLTAVGGNKANPLMTRYAIDPCSRNNNFSTPGGNGTVISENFKYSYSLNVTNGLLMRIVPLYTNSKIGVVGSAGLTFPAQGKQIEATGTTGDTVRKISFVQSYPSIPAEFFQYSLLSQ